MPPGLSLHPLLSPPRQAGAGRASPALDTLTPGSSPLLPLLTHGSCDVPVRPVPPVVEEEIGAVLVTAEYVGGAVAQDGAHGHPTAPWGQQPWGEGAAGTLPRGGGGGVFMPPPCPPGAPGTPGMPPSPTSLPQSLSSVANWAWQPLVSLPTLITAIAMVTILLISDNLLLGRLGTAAVPTVVGQHGAQAGMFPAALPLCPRPPAMPPALQMLWVPEGSARVMVGTGVLGKHLVALVPSTGRGSATRWGSPAA